MTRAAVLLPEPELADDGNRALPMQGKADLVQDLELAVVRGDALQLDQRHGRGGHRVGRRLAEGSHAQQVLGVGLARRLDQRPRLAQLDHVAVAQHHDAVGHLRHDGEIVGDVEGRRVELLDHVADRRQHLDLRGDVERGRRLVEDDQVGSAGHRHGRHGPLQLATRHLMGITKADRLRLRAGVTDRTSPSRKPRSPADCRRRARAVSRRTGRSGGAPG